MNPAFKNYLSRYTEASTLAFFRLVFGFMMVLSLVRFTLNGWIDKFYIKPQFHFTYYGFSWVKPIGDYTYILFVICGIAAVFFTIGYKYRLAAITFFLSFTYIELMDKTTYLNHYYFITVISFVMIFLPANAYFSVDAYKNSGIAFQRIPRWTTDVLKLLFGIVYFYAGLAKLNSDWLFHAMPLKIWLSSHYDMPIIGGLLHKGWMQFVFSWTGAIYDLVIVFLLLNKRTRFLAYLLVVVFHLLTALLFPIGVFPHVMIITTLIFFSADFHKRVLQFIAGKMGVAMNVFDNAKEGIQHFGRRYNLKITVLTAFIVFQLLFPFRYLCYPGELFWTEEGFRFSWRVMLMEKAGYTQFIVTDSVTKEKVMVNNEQFLSRFQEKQMSFQPDFILEYAHILHDYYQKAGMHDPEVRVQGYVALNGRLSKLYIDPTIDLAKENETFKHKTWILPFHDNIKGL